MSAPGGRNGRAKTDDRGNSVWTFVDDEGRDVSTVRTERVLALGDELTLAQTDIQPKPIMAAAPAAPSAPARAVPQPAALAEPTRPPRKPLSRQELQKLSDEIVRQRQAREAAAGKAGKPSK
jgi:hypothetical protein